MSNQYARAAADIAAEAGRFLKHFSDAHRLEVETKGSEFDFVTNADRASQRLIADRLKAAFPDHRFVGEEDGLTDAEVAAMLEGGGDDWFWVCDPLDGTANYIRGLGVYAVSLGLVHRGRSMAGAICLPETGEVFCAARGEGATLDGAPIRASDCTQLRRAFVACDLPVVDLNVRERFTGWMARAAVSSSKLRVWGSACAAIALVACGRLDAYFNLGLHPWDVAAGIVLLEEAGGAVSDIDSRPFRFDMSGGFLGCAAGLEGAFRGVIGADAP